MNNVRSESGAEVADSAQIIQVGVVDDQPLVRAGFSMVLESQDDIEVAWQASTGIEACEMAASHPVDIILMDVQMPDMDGISATRQILGGGEVLHGPGGETTKIVMLTTFDNDNYVMSSVEAGASGFLLKDADPEDLIAAVRTVGDSEAVISPRATARLMRQVREMGAVETREMGASDVREKREGEVRTPPRPEDPDDDLGLVDPLTPREREILILMALGRSNSEIADELFISLPTVKTHVGRVLMKTGSRDRVHAVLFAFRKRLISEDNLLG